MTEYIEFRLHREGEDAVDVTIRISADSSADALAEAFQSFMLAATYHPDTVKEVFNDADL